MFDVYGNVFLYNGDTVYGNVFNFEGADDPLAPPLPPRRNRLFDLEKIMNAIGQEFKAGHGTVGTDAQKVSTVDLPAYHMVLVKADLANTNNIYIGHSLNVTASNGYCLDGGEEVIVPIDNLGKLYVVGGASGQGYSWLVL